MLQGATHKCVDVMDIVGNVQPLVLAPGTHEPMCHGVHMVRGEGVVGARVGVTPFVDGQAAPAGRTHCYAPPLKQYTPAVPKEGPDTEWQRDLELRKFGATTPTSARQSKDARHAELGLLLKDRTVDATALWALPSLGVAVVNNKKWEVGSFAVSNYQRNLKSAADRGADLQSFANT
jgi:hypothetical protein